MPSWPDPDRIGDVTRQARGFIAAGDGRAAVNTALAGALQAAAAHRRRACPEDALLADAELTARLLTIARTWHLYHPGQPAASPLGRFDQILTPPAAAPGGTRP